MGSIFSTIRTFKYKNTIILNEDSPRMIQPANMAVSLYLHQLAAAFRMRELEMDRSITANIGEFCTDLYKDIYANAGFLCDNVGVGKTNTMLAVISSKRIPETDIRKQICPSNVIIIPSHLVNQWIMELTKTDLNYVLIQSYEHIDNILDNTFVTAEIDMDNDNLILLDGIRTYNVSSNVTRIKDMFGNSTVVITTPVMFPKLHAIMKYCDYDMFARVIMDDIDYVKSCYIAGLFNWIISATPVPYELRSDEAMFTYTHIKNDDGFVEKSINLPKPNHILINTRVANLINSIKDYIPSSIMAKINAGDTQDLVKTLNCGVETQENIIQLIVRKYQTKLDHINSRIDARTDNKELAALQKQATDLQAKIDYINQRIKDMMKDDCFICLDNYNTPVIMKCCNNIMCLECLKKCTHKSKLRCPFCRTLATNSDYIHINENANSYKIPTDAPYDSMRKKDALNDILYSIHQTVTSPRIIVCSDHNESFDNFYLNTDLKYSKLSGDIALTLDDFANGKFNILLLNSKEHGKGLNMQFVDYIIFFHQTDPNTETQVIGRAQRPGRTGPLQIIHLRNNTESPMSNVTAIINNTEFNKYLIHVNKN